MKCLVFIALLLMSNVAFAGGTYNPSTGGGGTPGGTNGQIQYNNSGAFGGVTVVPVANGGTGIAASNGFVQAWPNKRVPSALDSSTSGYANSQYWNYGNQFWYSIYTNSNYANWQPQELASAPVCNLVSGCAGAYGVFRLNSSYSGNAFNVTRASDSTTLAVPFDVNGIASWASVDSFCVGTTCTVNTLYDQSGNGYDLTNATVSGQPKITGGYINGMRAITFDGYTASRSLTNTALSITNVQNVSVMAIAKTEGGGGATGNTFFQIGSSTAKFIVFSNPAASYAYFSGSSNALGVGLTASYSELYTTVVTGGVPVFTQNNLIKTGSTNLSSSASTGLILGATTVAGYPGSYDMTAFVIWNSALSSANQKTAQQSLYQVSSIQPQINDNIVFLGDSITCCTTLANSVAPPDQSYATLLLKTLDHPFVAYNYGFPGQSLSYFVTNAGTLTGYSYLAGANNIAVIFAGTNDISASTSITAANLFSYEQSVCTAVHTVGYKCVVASLLPRSASFSGGQTSAGFEITRQAFESLLTNSTTGWTSFADGFIDLTADPIMGPQSAASITTLYSDGIHPTAPLGNSYVAAAFARGLKPLIQ